MEKWRQYKSMGYEVSNMGNIRNKKTGKILRPFDRAKYGHKLRRGYLTVHLCGGRGEYKNRTVHSIVMETFIGKRQNGMVINHKNGIRGDNRLMNLEYCTQSENRKEDFRLGRQSLRGEKNTRSKLSECQVLQIIGLYKGTNESYSSLAKRFDISRGAIANIFSGHCWSYLTGIKP